MKEFTKLLNMFPESAKLYLVGGCVRDFILNQSFDNIKDFDVEIHDMPLDLVEDRLIYNLVDYSKVGKSFGVFKFKINGLDFDLSLPRKDSKTKNGHCGFEVEVDPHMGIKEALRRRDFTINAIAMLLHREENMWGFIDFQYFDYFGGLRDLKKRILRMVDSETFADDPLRVLRGVQFAGRFGLSVDPETFEKMEELIL